MKWGNWGLSSCSFPTIVHVKCCRMHKIPRAPFLELSKKNSSVLETRKM